MVPELIDVQSLHGLPVLITTIREAESWLKEKALMLSELTGQPFIERTSGLPALYQYATQSGLVDRPPSGILVVRRHDNVVWMPHGEVFEYHPGMAVHRVKTLRDGGNDPMVEAMELQAGDKVLDCTAGLCSDAAVASYVVGDDGIVRALEASLPIALTVARGLATYTTERGEIESALRRIQLVAARAQSVLPNLAPSSYDVVYFDPMFSKPVKESKGIAPLRHLADPSPISRELLSAAARVARRAVVVKVRTGEERLFHLPMTRFVGNRKRRIGYVVIAGDELRWLLGER